MKKIIVGLMLMLFLEAMVSAMAELGEASMQKPVSPRGMRLLKEGGPRGKSLLTWRRTYYQASSRRQDGWDWYGYKYMFNRQNLRLAGFYINQEESMLILTDKALSGVILEKRQYADDAQEWEEERLQEELDSFWR